MGQANDTIVDDIPKDVYATLENAIASGESVLFIGADQPSVIKYMLTIIHRLPQAVVDKYTLFQTHDEDSPVIDAFLPSDKVLVHLHLRDERMQSLFDFHVTRLLVLSSVQPAHFEDYILALHQTQVITAMIADNPAHAIAQLRDDLCERIPKLSAQEAHKRIIRQLPIIIHVNDTLTITKTTSL